MHYCIQTAYTEECMVCKWCVVNLTMGSEGLIQGLQSLFYVKPFIYYAITPYIVVSHQDHHQLNYVHHGTKASPIC